MRKVTIESPLAPQGERYGSGEDELKKEFEENVEYAKCAMLDCFTRGEAPFASHLLYPQVLDDADKAQRRAGMRAGLHISDAMDAHVVYTDLGISRGMKSGIARAEKNGKDVEMRTMKEWTRKVGPSVGASDSWETTGKATDTTDG